MAARRSRRCDVAAYSGLADLYLSHPAFVARYEALAPGFSAFLAEAMKARTEGRRPRIPKWLSRCGAVAQRRAPRGPDPA